MQLCILFVIAFSLVATELFPGDDVSGGNLKLAAVGMGQLLVLLLANVIVIQTQANASLAKEPREAERAFQRGVEYHLTFWAVVSVCTFACFDWGQMVMASANGWSVFVARPLMLLPILSPLILSWAFLFDAERLLDGDRHTTRWDYVFSKARSFLLLPLTVLLVVVIWSDFVEQQWPVASWWTLVLRLIPVLGLGVTFPLVLRKVWKTRPLPASELRQRLLSCSERVGFAARDLLVWDTRQRLTNAAITGLVPGYRYILLSDRLIRELPPHEIEMIYMHEIGHAKHLHPVKLAGCLGILLANCSFLLHAILASPTLTWGLAGIYSSWVGVLFVIAALAASLWWTGHFARLMELQADLWAVRRIGDSEQYLRAMASVGGGNPEQTTWLHPSFQERCEFLLKDVQNAADLLRSKMQTAVFCFAVGSFVIAGIALLIRFQ